MRASAGRCRRRTALKKKGERSNVGEWSYGPSSRSRSSSATVRAAAMRASPGPSLGSPRQVAARRTCRSLGHAPREVDVVRRQWPVADDERGHAAARRRAPCGLRGRHAFREQHGPGEREEPIGLARLRPRVPAAEADDAAGLQAAVEGLPALDRVERVLRQRSWPRRRWRPRCRPSTPGRGRRSPAAREEAPPLVVVEADARQHAPASRTDPGGPVAMAEDAAVDLDADHAAVAVDDRRVQHVPAAARRRSPAPRRPRAARPATK